MATKKFIGLISLALLAYALAGCGGVYSTNGATGTTGEACGRGEALPSTTCNGRIGCAAGYVPGVVCTASGRFGDCTCVPGITAADAGTTPVGTVCVESATRASTCRACSSGQVAYETCRGNAWTACACVADHGNGTVCIPNSVTMNSCMACTGGVAQQRCAPDGRSYAACECVSNGSTRICSPGTVRYACNPCASGSAAGTEWCNEQGTGYTCRINSGATCSGGGSTQICNPGISRNTPCTFSCGSGTAPGTEFCNSAGNGYECRQNSGTSCSGGSTGGGGGCGGGTLVARARNANELVRCWGNGQVWTSTSRELRVQLDGDQCGYSECVTGTLASNGAFIENNYFATARNGAQGSIQDMFDFAGVEGRHADLVNQTSIARMWTDTRGRTKGVIALNIQCRGVGSNC